MRVRRRDSHAGRIAAGRHLHPDLDSAPAGPEHHGMGGGIPWQRRVQYSSGFLALGLVAEAAAELAALEGADRGRPEVLSALCDLHSETKDWMAMIEVGRILARARPDHPHGWISWAYALREVQRVEEARAVLLEAEPRHPACGVLHYNLACYACLLGDRPEAERRLRRALAIDGSWKDSALDDPDLAAMRTWIAGL
ncbi:MAG: tetratricopeptide repeat protein [Opitutaceae bacterium]|nr:tetratricopeptide repeat protein [Opitutaceae bacterium]